MGNMGELSVLLIGVVDALFAFFVVAPIMLNTASLFGVQKRFAQAMVEEGVIDADTVKLLHPKKQIAGVLISLVLFAVLIWTCWKSAPMGYLCGGVALVAGFLKYRKIVQYNSLTVKRQLEDGYMELKVQTPCLLTCIKELNTPRYMSVSGIFECYDKPVEVFDYNALKDDPLIETDTIGLKGSPTNVYKSFAPPVKGAGMMVEGAAQLVGILNDKHLI